MAKKGESIMSIQQKIGVVGAGQMGRGIAQVFAQQGFPVILVDPNAIQLEKAQKSILTSAEKLQEKGKLDPQGVEWVKTNIEYTSQLESLRHASWVIEAIVEQEAAKGALFRSLDLIVGPDTILATNTSSIPITRLAACTNRPDRVIGMHFMNPVPVMKLVEIIAGLATSDTTLQKTLEVVALLKKEAACSKDYPGFIVNRILMPMINEAFFALQEGLGTALDIDKGMKLGTNQPMGPLELADFIGLDTCLSILQVLQQGLGDPKYRPSPLLRQYVDAGRLGRKTGQGVYNY